MGWIDQNVFCKKGKITAWLINILFLCHLVILYLYLILLFMLEAETGRFVQLVHIRRFAFGCSFHPGSLFYKWLLFWKLCPVSFSRGWTVMRAQLASSSVVRKQTQRHNTSQETPKEQRSALFPTELLTGEFLLCSPSLDACIYFPVHRVFCFWFSVGVFFLHFICVIIYSFVSQLWEI